MILIYITAILSFFAVIFGVLGEVKNKENHINKFGFLTIFTALLICIVTCLQALAEQKEKKSAQEESKEMKQQLHDARDTISILKKEIDTLINISDSILASTNSVEETVIDEFTPFLRKRIDIPAKGIILISGRLTKDMRVRVTRGNCQMNVAMIHNGALIRIDNSNSQYWEHKIDDSGQEGATYFSNESQLQCTMEIEIYGKDKEGLWKNLDISDDSQLEASPNVKRSNSSSCELNDLNFDGTWQMVQYYDKCLNNTSNISWEELVVYYDVSKFNRIGKYFELNANKIGEKYKGQNKTYSRFFPLETKPGTMQNCKILIPLVDIVETDNGNTTNRGEIWLTSYEIENERIILYGEFSHKMHGCSGQIVLFKN